MTRPATEPHTFYMPQQLAYTIDGAYAYNLTSRDAIVGAYREYVGTTTPGFKGKQKHALPFNGFHMQKYTRSTNGATWDISWQQTGVGGAIQTHRQFGKRWSAIYVSGDFIGTGHMDTAEFRAAEDLARKFNEVKTNLPMLFKERVKTSQMIYKTAGRLVLGINALRKLRFGEAYRHLGIDPTQLYPAGLMRIKRLEEVMTRNRRKAAYNKRKGRKAGRTAAYIPSETELSNLWLEISFGWKPLLQDIFKSAELLASRYADDGVRYSAKGNGRDKIARKCTVYPHPDVSYFFPPVEGGTSFKATTVKLIAEYSISSEARIKMAETGITNPLLVAWDIVPFSFVVDWFLPVNNWLKQLDTYSGFTLASVKRVRFTRVFTDVRSNRAIGRATVGGITYFGIQSNVTAFSNEVLYDRDSIGSPPFVPLEFRDPFSPRDLKKSNDPNLFPAITTMALLTKAFRPGGGRYNFD